MLISCSKEKDDKSDNRTKDKRQHLFSDSIIILYFRF
jgi:hypothetical protein